MDTNEKFLSPFGHFIMQTMDYDFKKDGVIIPKFIAFYELGKPDLAFYELVEKIKQSNIYMIAKDSGFRWILNETK